jgi:hypothetical protein
MEMCCVREKLKAVQRTLLSCEHLVGNEVPLSYVNEEERNVLNAAHSLHKHKCSEVEILHNVSLRSSQVTRYM